MDADQKLTDAEIAELEERVRKIGLVSLDEYSVPTDWQFGELLVNVIHLLAEREADKATIERCDKLWDEKAVQVAEALGERNEWIDKAHGLEKEIKRLKAILFPPDLITIDPDIRSGVPVLKGTRVSLGQILAEIADGSSTVEIAEDLRFVPDFMREYFERLSIAAESKGSEP